MTFRLLITGVNGFVGRHFLPAVRQAHPDWKLCAWTHGGSLDPALSEACDSHTAVDLTDAEAVDQAIAQQPPDAVLHLAAQSHVPTAFEQPVLTFRVNVEGTLNLMLALGRHAPRALFVQVGSSEVYGRSFAAGTALNEDAPFQPMNPYASSKAAADLLAGQYALTTELHIVRLRAFNHMGAGQRADFVTAGFAAQIAAIERGGVEPVMRVGNLTAKRDFLDVADIVSAYLTVLERGRELESGTAINLCSGRATAIQTVLELLLAEAKCPVQVEQDPKRMRPSDIPVAVGDNSRALALLGWRPTVSLESALAGVLAWWRTQC